MPNKRNLNIISSTTLLPLGGVIFFISILIGGIIWLTDMRGHASTNTEKIILIQKDIDNIHNFRTKMWQAALTQEERLSRIEGKLDIMYDHIKSLKHKN